jgi:hypothetical protein
LCLPTVFTSACLLASAYHAFGMVVAAAFVAATPVAGSFAGISPALCRGQPAMTRCAPRTVVTAGLFSNIDSPFANPFAKRVDDGVERSFGFTVSYAYLANPIKGSGEDAFFVEGSCCGVFDGELGVSYTCQKRIMASEFGAVVSRQVQLLSASLILLIFLTCSALKL